MHLSISFALLAAQLMWKCSDSLHGNTRLKAALAHVQVKYDTFVTVYMSDCDFYPRVRAAGFETLNYPQVSQPPLRPHKLFLHSAQALFSGIFTSSLFMIGRWEAASLSVRFPISRHTILAL